MKKRKLLKIKDSPQYISDTNCGAAGTLVMEELIKGVEDLLIKGHKEILMCYPCPFEGCVQQHLVSNHKTQSTKIGSHVPKQSFHNNYICFSSVEEVMDRIKFIMRNGFKHLAIRRCQCVYWHIYDCDEVDRRKM